MTKFSISIPDEIASKLEALAKQEGKTLSGAITEALVAYFSEGSERSPQSSSSSGASTPAPMPNGSGKTPPPVTPEGSPSQASTIPDPRISALNARVDDLDMRLSRLWNEVHDQ